MEKKDLTGNVIGNFTVISRIPEKSRYWLCRCKCGKEKKIRGSNIPWTQSCGCMSKRKYNAFKHGLSKTRIYCIWNGLAQRTMNPRNASWGSYGGRGIGIDERWKKFSGFLLDMGSSYSEHCATFGEKQTSIERVDNNLGYTKENCRWATKEEQSRNTRCVRLITIEGETHHLAEWLRIANVSSVTFRTRLKLGWSIEKAIKTPLQNKNKGI